MNRRVVFFNILYYGITIALFVQGKMDPSSSLGYGYFIVAFWIISIVALVVLIKTKFIRVKSVADYIGIFTATPILPIAYILIIVSFSDNHGNGFSESYFNKDKYRYRELVYINPGDFRGERTEYYRSKDTISRYSDVGSWVKDSTWILTNEQGIL